MNIGRILLVSLFIVTGIRGMMNFNQYKGAVASKNIPFPAFVAVCALLLKVVGGLVAGFSYNRLWANTATIGLIIFTALATVLFHNAFADKSQFGEMMKNISIIGGLILSL